MTKTSYNRSFNKSQNRVSYYDTRVGSIYFGNTVKDKQLMDFNELIQAQQDDKGKKTIKVEESVKNNIVPNQYRTELEEKPTSKTRTRAIAPVKITNPYYHILMNKKEKEKRKSKSVIQKRKNWNTSSRKENDNDDSPLDLGKKNFGQEYRAVLDKLLEPKLPNDKELQCDPSYEYAQKAMKLRRVKKIDLIKNKGFLTLIRRNTELSDIRTMLAILNKKGRTKFSMLEVDRNLGMK